MPRHPKTHVTEPKEWFSCLVAYCPTKFRSIHGRTRHINTKHTRDELQQDDIQLDLPIVSESPRIPQRETLDELDSEASNDFELPIDSPVPGHTTYIQPQLEEHSEFFSPSPPPFGHLNSPTPIQELMETSPSPPPFGHLNSPTPFQELMETEYHPFINGTYIYFSSCCTY